MPNHNYQRGRRREYEIKEKLTGEGWLCFRTAGSHSLADIVALKPAKCGHADCFKVKLVQSKSAKDIKAFTIEPIADLSGIFPVNVEFWRFPTKAGASERKKKRVHNKRLLQKAKARALGKLKSKGRVHSRSALR